MITNLLIKLFEMSTAISCGCNFVCSLGLMKAATLLKEQNKLKQEKSPEYAAIYLVNKLIHNDEMGRNMQQCTDKLHLSRPFSPLCSSP